VGVQTADGRWQAASTATQSPAVVTHRDRVVLLATTAAGTIVTAVTTVAGVAALLRAVRGARGRALDHSATADDPQLAAARGAARQPLRAEAHHFALLERPFVRVACVIPVHATRPHTRARTRTHKQYSSPQHRRNSIYERMVQSQSTQRDSGLSDRHHDGVCKG
jgi:hypothetical protein